MLRQGQLYSLSLLRVVLLYTILMFVVKIRNLILSCHIIVKTSMLIMDMTKIRSLGSLEFLSLLRGSVSVLLSAIWPMRHLIPTLVTIPGKNSIVY